MNRGRAKAKDSWLCDLLEIVGNFGDLFESPWVIAISLLLLVMAGIVKLWQWIDSLES